jgi:bifunctional DNA-binding transcriptional regulator/antitoxin component of YhaV-PrlF toxin-antitoxin module
VTKVININQRGTLTLPKEMRDKLGLNDAGQVVAEETTQGILIRAGVTFPIEMYTDKRVAEFDRINEQALRRYRLKTKR